MAQNLHTEACRMKAVPASSPAASGRLAQYNTQDRGLWGFVDPLKHDGKVTKTNADD